MIVSPRPLVTDGLRLEPLTVGDAAEMFDVLADPEAYRFLDQGPPPSLEHLVSVYERRESGRSPDGSQRWLNWMVRGGDDRAIGYVQATLTDDGTAWVAWFLHSAHWGRGHAYAAATLMLDDLVARFGARRFLATVEVANARSIALLERLSFRAARPDEAARHDLTPTERLFIRESLGSRLRGYDDAEAGPRHRPSPV